GDFDYGDSYRTSAMIDFSPSEFSRIRFQVSNGDYETAAGTENVWEGFVQLVVSLGAHGAHKF
ncbi:MAG: zinc-regulated TonB-dependent outer membrane receptor, partial [Verrucomicrobia bacterium]|nr:zinc-regulated TonB-dependent outer membrane receptor [Verrucomicrobiota bacterium]